MDTTIVRISKAEIESRALERAPGYVEALLAAGRPDPDGVHWLIPQEKLLEVWARFGAPPAGCAGCGD